MATTTGQEAMTTKSRPGHAATKNKKTKMQAMVGQVVTSTGQEATTTKTRPSTQTATGQATTTTKTKPGHIAAKIFPCMVCGSNVAAQECRGKGSNSKNTGKTTTARKKTMAPTTSQRRRGGQVHGGWR